VANLEHFPLEWTSTSGYSGKSIVVQSAGEFLRYRKEKDTVLLINCDPEISFKLAAGLWFRKKPDLVSLDLVLRRPNNLRSYIALPVRRLLLERFDHHIHYFRDLRAYSHVYGITPERSSFVPFKVNHAIGEGHTPDGSGEYVLCLGQSMRDFDTFFTAMERLDCPAVIPEPNFELLRKHGSKFTRPLSELPRNVRLLADDKTVETQDRLIRKARLIVLPILKTSMVASGIGTSLNSMFAGKCVIGTEGPGMSDIFEKEMLFAPPEDPEALARVIQLAWQDTELRQRTAMAGQRLAKSLGGEPELYQRVIDAVVNWSVSREEK
jgi:glycosyltransferase involved in cell wall biosynthesis